MVDPRAQQDRSRAYFGAVVTIADEDDNQRTLTLVGDDEADAGNGLVGWNAPLARALRGATVGDLRRVELPVGTIEYEVMKIDYRTARMQTHRRNIQRYGRLLATELTDLERKYLHRRIAEEQAELERLAQAEH